MSAHRMNPYRFEALAMWARSTVARVLMAECSMWSSEDERLLALVIMDMPDRDFNYVVLARDRMGRYRAVDVGDTYMTRRLAETALKEKMAGLRDAPDSEFEQGDEERSPLDLFTPHVPREQLHPDFVSLTEQRGYSPALGILREMANVFEDRDGNFVRDFQTNGFNSRLWELYLFAALVEEGFTLDRTHAQPDFMANKLGDRVCVEAVTVHPTNSQKPPEPETIEEVRELLQDYMPIKFGSALFSKLKKRYWDKEHVKDAPFVIALADFHGPRSMTWSGSALHAYLYGLRADVEEGPEGALRATYTPVDEHAYGSKRIPSGFFSQPDAENVAAVLFTNAGTIAKFNRMGVLADFGAPEVRVVRRGFRVNPDPKAVTPLPFAVDVDDPSYTEGWADELQLFHNPRAKHPLEPRLFPSATHHFLKDGQITSYGPPDSVLGSVTLHFLPRERLAEDKKPPESG